MAGCRDLERIVIRICVVREVVLRLQNIADKALALAPQSELSSKPGNGMNCGCRLTGSFRMSPIARRLAGSPFNSLYPPEPGAPPQSLVPLLPM